MLRQISDYPGFFGFSDENPPCQGNFTIPYAGEMHGVQLDIHSMDGETIYMIRIGCQPYLAPVWKTTEFCYAKENEAAQLRNRTSCITNAVSSLYEILESLSDECPPMLFEEQMKYLDIIFGSCRLLQKQTLFSSELNKYYLHTNLETIPLSLNEALSDFVDYSRKILGTVVWIDYSAENNLCISVNYKRLTLCLLAIVVYMHKTQTEFTNLEIHAEAQQEQVVVTIHGSSRGTNNMPLRHNKWIPFYTSALHSEEERCIQLFCQQYQVAMLYTSAENQTIYTLRFPRCHDKPISPTFSIEEIIMDEKHVLFQTALSDISSYRFY